MNLTGILMTNLTKTILPSFDAIVTVKVRCQKMGWRYGVPLFRYLLHIVFQNKSQVLKKAVTTLL